MAPEKIVDLITLICGGEASASRSQLRITTPDAAGIQFDRGYIERAA